MPPLFVPASPLPPPLRPRLPARRCARPPRRRLPPPRVVPSRPCARLSDGAPQPAPSAGDTPPASASASASAPPPPRTQQQSRAALDREILALALPALGALALDPLLSLIDTAFVGRLGVSPIAGVGLSTIVLNVSFSVFNFLCVSMTPLVARATAVSAPPSVSASDDFPPVPAAPPPYAASRVISAGLLLALGLGLVLGVALWLCASPLCLALGATADALPPAVAYLRARALASPFALMSLVANGALRGYRDLRTPFYVAAVANLLNVALDVVLIFYAGLGVAGAAYATSVSQVVAVTAMLAALFARRRLRAADLVRIPTLRELRPMLGAGVMLTIRTVSLLAAITYATASAAAKGVTALAAYEVCRQLWIFKATVLDSFAAAAQALVASAMAGGAVRRARRVADRCMQLGAVGGAVLGVAAVAAGTRLPGLFTGDAQVRAVAARCIRVAAVCAPLNGFVFALDGVLTGCCDYRYMAGGIAVASLTCAAALTAVRVGGGGVDAIWAALNVLMVARAAVLYARYRGDGSPIPRAAAEAEAAAAVRAVEDEAAA